MNEAAEEKIKWVSVCQNPRWRDVKETLEELLIHFEQNENLNKMLMYFALV